MNYCSLQLSDYLFQLFNKFTYNYFHPLPFTLDSYLVMTSLRYQANISIFMDFS